MVDELRRVDVAESLAFKDCATEYFKSSEYGDAVQSLSAAIGCARALPSMPFYCVLREIMHCSIHSHAQTLTLTLIMPRLDPSNHVFYSNRSVAYTALERFDAALADADECVRLQPGWAKGHQRRAAAKFHLGDLQAAKASYQAAWEIEPSNLKTKADLEHVLSEIAGMRVVLPERTI